MQAKFSELRLGRGNERATMPEARDGGRDWLTDLDGAGGVAEAVAREVEGEDQATRRRGVVGASATGGCHGRRRNGGGSSGGLGSKWKWDDVDGVAAAVVP